MSPAGPSRSWFDGSAVEGDVERIDDIPGRPLDAQPEGEQHPFDRKNRVDTSGLYYADKLPSGHAHDAASEGYYATAPSLFHGALSCWQQTLAGHALQDYTFIDLGCGKGRALLMASDYPFRKVTGVELSPKLARVARHNLIRWVGRRPACFEISVMVGDVMQTRLPLGPVVLFLFNSFGASVMTAVLQGLTAGARVRTTPIDLIYVHPEQDALVRQAAGVQVLVDEEVPFSPEDAAADAFGVSHDRCVVYRVTG